MEGYVGQVILFAGDYAPKDWAFCHGQIIPISENNILFSILGTYYGGDGRTTFGLPDLRSRVPLGAGQGPGLYPYRLGQMPGRQSNILTVDQMPRHSHAASGEGKVTNFKAIKEDVATGVLGSSRTNSYNVQEVSINTSDTVEIDYAGGTTPIDNVQPSVALNYIICVNGLYPSRS